MVTHSDLAPGVEGKPAVEAWTFPRGSASVALMARFAAEHGVPVDDVLQGSGITASAASDPATQIDAHQELAVVRNLVGALGHRPALGLEVGRRYRLSTFGIFGFACLSSQTLRDAITFALRYWDLSFAFAIPVVEIADGKLRLELRDGDVPEDVRRFAVERDLAAIFTVLRELLTVPVGLLSQRFRFPPPQAKELPAYEDVFGVRPTFGAADNVGYLDGALLDHPLPKADPQTVAECEAACRELVARKRTRTGLSQQVRARLLRIGALESGIDAGMEAVARDLHISVRTLRRRLSEDGTSYRELRDEVREALAEELLATGALSVSDVAIRLGYAEATSFIAAFRRWKGVTPAAYARRLRASG